MATKNDDEKKPGVADDAASEALRVRETSGVPERSPEPTGDVPSADFGVQRYVHAAFLAAGILLAFISGKILTAVWNELADWPAAVRTIPQLVTYPEEQRETFMLALGAVIGAVTIIQMYRREGIRQWANDVANELSKVTWPNRETVVNGTIVVVIATTVGTAYVAVLDRFWSFLTNLVYGT